MPKSFYNSSHQIDKFDSNRLKRDIQDGNVNRDLIAGDYRKLEFKIAEPLGYDPFTVSDFVMDGNWHILDLNNLIDSANPVQVDLSFFLRATTANERLLVYPYLNDRLVIPEKGAYRMRTQVANGAIDFNVTLLIDREKKILYRTPDTAWTSINLQVLGWWE